MYDVCMFINKRRIFNQVYYRRFKREVIQLHRKQLPFKMKEKYLSVLIIFFESEMKKKSQQGRK